MDSKDTRRPPPDEDARWSFRWRRMTRKQITGLIIALIVMLIAIIWWEGARAALLADLTSRF